MTAWLLALLLTTNVSAPSLSTPPSAPPAALQRVELDRPPLLIPLTQRWAEARPDSRWLPDRPAGNLNSQPYLIPPDAQGLPRSVILPRGLTVPGGTAWW